MLHPNTRLGTDIYKEYLSHALCLGGACKFEFNGNPFELHEGDCMIVRKGKLVEKITPSADFKVKVIYVTPQFIVKPILYILEIFLTDILLLAIQTHHRIQEQR